ncbi:MAG TPA: hypothetical protein VH988_21310 [Thermoanaerobaculia bacterium]|jgi:hypothetical protein|nr:hypothetical protein [Thermoanaerobaculia bacterium]
MRRRVSSLLLVFGVALCLPAPGIAGLLDGPEFQVNAKSAGRQGAPGVAVAADGHFVAVWVDGGVRGKPANVMARIFAADGTPQTGDIRISTQEPGFQDHPRVAATPNGGFVVVWSARTSGAPQDIPHVYGRLFAKNGAALGERFRLGTGYGLAQTEPTVARGPDGRFVVAWTEDDGRLDPQGAHTSDVLARRFGANGHPLAVEWTAIGGDQYQLAPAVSMNADGAFVIAAEEDAYTTTQVYAALYGPDGTIQHFVYVPYFWRSNGSNPRTPAVAMQPDGGFVLAWADNQGDRETGVLDPDKPGVIVQRIDNRGEWRTNLLNANTTIRDVQSEPAVAAAPDGGFLVVWTSAGGQDGDGRGVFAQRFGPDGSKIGPETALATWTTGNQSLPAVAATPDGRGVVVWQSMLRDGDDFGIAARRVSLQP